MDSALQNGGLMSADAPEFRAERPVAKGSFPRAVRLLKHSDFDRVYKQGRRHFSSHMTVFYLRRSDESSQAKGPRIGFTVGRVLGGAVERNRIKRRLREAVRQRRAVLTGSMDVVINPKKSVLALEFSVVLDEVGRALDLIAKKMVEK
jgi:ribonuclease P protein component